MAKLVNKQFNSPIGLYSQQNIQEVLDKDTQILANGAVGIDFKNPSVGKPDNLKNSAVLRMLEEEENRQRNGYGPGSDRILKPLRSWPPPEYEQKNHLRATFKDVVTPGVKRVAWPPPHETGEPSPNTEQNSVQPQGGPQYPSEPAGFQQNNYQSQSVPSNTPYRAPLKLDVSQSGSSPLPSPLSNQSPLGYRPASPNKGWASVQSPVSAPNQPSWRQNNPTANQQNLRQTASTPAPWRQASPTRFQSAHQPVSQQTFLGQQYSGTPQQQYQSPNQYQQQYQTPQHYQAPAQSPGQQHQAPSQQYQSPVQQYQAPTHQHQSSGQQYQAPSQLSGREYQIPIQHYQSPVQQSNSPTQQYQSSNQQYQTSTQQYQYSQQYQSEQVSQYKQSPQGYIQTPQSNQVQNTTPQVKRQAFKPVEPPPSTISLRPQAPVSQASPPVYTSQPATATLKGGKHLRGDLKWPPEEVKLQAAEENRLRLELAKGPVCRPRKVHRDYMPFFEQHALNSTYPGYKIPPGTQFYRTA